MNFNVGFNVNTTVQRVLTQSCFKCGGDGKLYPFENKRGIPSNCNACSGDKVIDGSYTKCHWCQGEAKVYPFENKRGIPSDCYICNGMGYLPERLELCIQCNGEGKTYPFSGRRGIASDCNKCLGKGGFPVDKKYLVTTTTSNNGSNFNYNQNQNYNNNFNYQGYSSNTTNTNNYNSGYSGGNSNTNSNYNQGSTNMIQTSFEPITNTNSQPMIQTSFQPINTNSNYNNNFQPITTTNYNSNSAPLIQTSFQPITTTTTTTNLIQTSFEPIQTVTNKLAFVHPHGLFQSTRTYQCNLCNKVQANAKALRCDACDFDVCENCDKRVNFNQQNSDIHFHPLAPTVRQNAWVCNGCRTSYVKNRVSWYCAFCDYDACVVCYHG